MTLLSSHTPTCPAGDQGQLDEETGGDHLDGDLAPRHRGEGEQEDGGGPEQFPRLPLLGRHGLLLRLWGCCIEFLVQERPQGWVLSEDLPPKQIRILVYVCSLDP